MMEDFDERVSRKEAEEGMHRFAQQISHGSWAFWVILVWDYFVFCTVALQNHGAGSFCGLLSRIW
jgi:hypothetical protein